MTTKLKLISISLALFLIVALSAALAFALPKEEFNLSGSLSYEPSFVSYTPAAGDLIPADFQLKLFNDGTFEFDYDVTAIQLKMKNIYTGFIDENGRVVVKEQSLQYFNPLTGEKLFPSLKDQRPLISASNFMPSGASIGFLNENVFYFNGIILIREGLDPSAVAFVGFMTNRLEEGCDLTLPRQTQNLTGDALKEQFGNTWLTLLTGAKAYYNSISIKDIISFSKFDQTTTGLKTVQITFPSPIDNSETISAEIKVFVYEDEADLPGNQLSFLSPSGSASETLSLAIPRGATAKQFVDHINSISTNWLDYYSSSGSERVVITEDMISEFTINGDKGYCKVTYKDASAYLQFYVYEEGEENLPLALVNLPTEELFVMPAGNTINFSETGLYVVTNSANEVLVAQQELYQNGVKISQEELFATGGEKNYQIEFVGGNGTTIYLDMKTFVYDASYSVPTHAALPLGFSENVTILEDGSLDLEGLYITIYYNGKENSMSNPDLIPETDHVEVPLSSEDVKIEYVVDGNTAIIVSISIKINFNGHEVYHGLTNH